MPVLTVDQFKTNFAREFPYGDTAAFVMSSDITRAINEATMMFSEALWDSDTEKQIALGYCAAHFLALNIQAAGGLGGGQGIDSRGVGIVQNKSVDSVSEAYYIPESIANDRLLGQFMTTSYGQRYLHMLAPRVIGNVIAVTPETFA